MRLSLAMQFQLGVITFWFPYLTVFGWCQKWMEDAVSYWWSLLTNDNWNWETNCLMSCDSIDCMTAVPVVVVKRILCSILWSQDCHFQCAPSFSSDFACWKPAVVTNGDHVVPGCYESYTTTRMFQFPSFSTVITLVSQWVDAKWGLPVVLWVEWPTFFFPQRPVITASIYTVCIACLLNAFVFFSVWTLPLGGPSRQIWWHPGWCWTDCGEHVMDASVWSARERTAEGPAVVSAELHCPTHRIQLFSSSVQLYWGDMLLLKQNRFGYRWNWNAKS